MCVQRMMQTEHCRKGEETKPEKNPAKRPRRLLGLLEGRTGGQDRAQEQENSLNSHRSSFEINLAIEIVDFFNVN